MMIVITMVTGLVLVVTMFAPVDSLKGRLMSHQSIKTGTQSFQNDGMRQSSSLYDRINGGYNRGGYRGGGGRGYRGGGGGRGRSR